MMFSQLSVPVQAMIIIVSTLFVFGVARLAYDAGRAAITRNTRREISPITAAALIIPSRRLTPARHHGMLEHLQQIKKDLDTVSEATRSETAVGDAAMLYQIVRWLAPITEELLCEHVKIAPAMTLEEEAPRKPLNARYRAQAAGAFGMAKPDGDRPL